jgi:predicted nucleotide-binding protein (sugar kinase/HSP70/actin superfamily)
MISTISKKKDKLDGRTVWVPRMTHIGARMVAATFRSIGIDAAVTPPSDDKTLELGGLYTSGEECYPEKITLGDFLRIIHAKDFNPDRTAFLMPTAEGPCRFGQYGPYLRVILDEMGYQSVPIISPTSKNSYDDFGSHATTMVRRLWRGMVASDVLRKMLLKTRPYETRPGDSDQVYAQSIERIEKVCERPHVSMKEHVKALTDALVVCRDSFRAVPARYVKGRPLIGVVGEIFCRLNTFSNYEAVRKIEAHGGEAWLSDMTEWVWYTNWSQKALLRRDGRTFSASMLGALIKNAVQRRDEHHLLKPFAEELAGYEEPHDVYEDVLKDGWPYLPADGALGEMVLSVGKSIYLHGKGADGIIDISPFSCMNGIVSEAVYHSVSHDYDDMPIRNFYFDSTSSNMERDLDIFMELADSYRKRKKMPRRYPEFFQ